MKRKRSESHDQKAQTKGSASVPTTLAKHAKGGTFSDAFLVQAIGKHQGQSHVTRKRVQEIENRMYLLPAQSHRR